jgi:hypothetical protein
MPKFGQNIFSSRLFAQSDSAAFGYDAFTRLAATPNGAVRQMALDSAGGFATYKSGTGFVLEGPGNPVGSSTPLLIGADDAGDGIGLAPGNPTITVGADPHYVGTIGINGDQDYYAVTLVAGKTYEIGMFGYTGGPNFIALPDSYLELYNAAGVIQGSADGGASTLANQVNSGFDAVLTFTVTTSGTYYINARAFDNHPADGTTGEGVGDYELYVNEVDPNAPGVYHPYYDASSPLYAIDWGTQVDKVNHTARNPDGNEGTRSTSANGADPTGNPQGTPSQAAQFHYDPDGDGPLAIQTYDAAGLAAVQGKDIAGKNVVTIYFARPGDVFVSNDPTNPGLPPATITAVAIKDYEYTAVWTALAEFSKVADVVYLEVSDRDDADFIYTSYTGTPGPGVSLLGSMSPPGESDEGLAQFNSNDERWNARDLAQGGFSFVTLIHEFGHGHGLAHPHDNGGHSGIMNGVEPEGAGVADYTTGDYDLNQSVYTMMSYEDGWQTSPYGNASTTAGYGYLGGLMAFDIAAIQDKYGVNEDTATGNDVYTLKDVNAAGTYYSSIWDGGGTDSIVYAGSRNANIDLRQATLQYEPGGGGFISYAYGIYGGFTIANGVTIENATSGSGNDTLRGNAANNILDGGAGNDVLWFLEGGNDTGIGGAGNDLFLFGSTMDGNDAVDGGAGTDQIALQGGGAFTFGTGVVGFESLGLLSGTDTRFGEAGGHSYSYDVTTRDVNVAAGVQLTVDGAKLRVGENLTFNGSAETDGSFFIYGGRGVDTLTGGAKNDAFLFGSDGHFGASDTVNGGAGIDQLALRGNYTLTFGAGQLVGIESIGLLSAQDTRYGPLGTSYSYNLTMNDGNVAGAAQLTIDGAKLRGGETLVFNGAAETVGSYRIFGGANGDTITSGQGNDLLQGNGGADQLTGGAGVDVFVYKLASDSAGNAVDHILDFMPGTDGIDLSRIDANTLVAGNQAFTYTESFSGTAGELMVQNLGGTEWLVLGDTDGDKVADLTIHVTATPTVPIQATDFFL